MFKVRGPLTMDMIKQYIARFKTTELVRYNRLYRYYKNDHDINYRRFDDDSKPNNRIAHDYAGYITDTLASYMVGKAVGYKCDNDILQQHINLIMDYNDSEDNDYKLAEFQSIFGVAYEVMYVDEWGKPRFIAVDPREGFPIYNNSIDNSVRAFIRFIEYKDPVTGEEIATIYVYDTSGVTTYEGRTIDSVGDAPVDFTASVFGDIAVNICYNNDFLSGDFEKVIPLIDAYDRMCSDTLNELDYFCDAYLLFKNAQLPDDVDQMKRNRLIELISSSEGVDVDAKFLTKNVNDAEIEHTKSRTVAEIHKLSKVPNLDPSAFVSHTTATHTHYSMLTTEQYVSQKEKKFRKCLKQRLEKLVYLLNLKVSGAQYDYTKIEITFNRNIPQTIEGISDALVKLDTILPRETVVGFIPGIKDPNGEVAKKRAQDMEELSMYSKGDEVKNEL